MSHQHFHTEAIVIKSFPHGEASKTIVLFTRKFGLIYARAQGVRKVSAKLHAHISEHVLSGVTLIKGREVWRLINAKRIAPQLQQKNFSRALRARLAFLLERFVTGQEENEELFFEYENIWKILDTYELSKQEQDYLEVVAVLRILHLLGYVGEGASFGPILRERLICREMLDHVPAIKSDAIAAINASFAHSQL